MGDMRPTPVDPGSGSPFLTKAAGDAAYPTVFNVLGYGAANDGSGDAATGINAALTAASNAGGGVVYLPAGTYGVFNPLVIPSNCQLQGAGMGATVIKRKALATVLKNSDYTGGNSHITVRDLTVDGDKATLATHSQFTYLIDFERASQLALVNVEARNGNSSGIFVTGNGGTDEDTWLTNVYAHDNVDDGIWIGAHARKVNYKGVYARNNGGNGVICDHSEALVEGIFADLNGLRGIWIRNVFACTYSNLVATRNGQHGIFAEGAWNSQGTAWRAQNNGTTGAGYSDIYLSGGNTAAPNYGTTTYLNLTGISAGPETVADGWTVTEDYALYVEDTVPGFRISGYRFLAGSLGDVRTPSNYQLVGDPA